MSSLSICMDRVVHGREEWHLLASKQNVHIGMLLVASFIIAQRCLRWLSQSSKPYVLEKKRFRLFFCCSLQVRIDCSSLFIVHAGDVSCSMHKTEYYKPILVPLPKFHENEFLRIYTSSI